MQYRLMKNLLPAGTVAAAALLTACATAKPVPDSERDTAGTYDAVWRVSILDATTTRQPFGNWIMNCEDMAWEFNVQVNGGVMKTVLDDTEHTANVDTEGNFMMVIPTPHTSSANPSAAGSIQRGAITLFVSGDLDGESPSGNYRAGIEEFANNGCRTKVAFERL